MKGTRHTTGRRPARGLGRIGVTALAAILAAFMVAVTGAAAAAPKTLTISTSLPVPTLDGIMSNAVESNRQIYGTLVEINANGKLSPNLATKWRSNPNGSRWTFTIRKNAKYSDGTVVKPSDVVFSFNKILATPASLLRGSVAPFVQGVYVQNGEVVFRMTRPNGNWPRQSSLIYIVPEAKYDPTRFASNPIGSGPFQVVKFDTNRELVLKPNPHYWGPKPAFSQVRELIITDEPARLNALRSRAVDVAALSATTVNSARSDKTLTTKVYPGSLASYIGFNTTTGALGNVNFRRAVDRAIDRAAIAKTIFGGLASPVGQLVAPVTFGYSKNPQLKPSVYNVTLAKSFLEQSGYTGETIDLTYPNGPALPGATLYAQAIQGYLQAVGINVTLKEMDQSTFLQNWLGRKLPGMFIFSFQPSQLDAGQVFNLILNVANYFTDPITTGLYRLQDAEPNETKRLIRLEDLSLAIKQNMYFSALHLYQRVFSYNPKKVNATPRADGYVYPQFYKAP